MARYCGCRRRTQRRRGERAQVGIGALQRVEVLRQVLDPAQGLAGIAVPQLPLDPLKRVLIAWASSASWALGVLAQHRQRHGDMEPVEVMLGAGRKAIHQGMEVVAAVGQEDGSWFIRRPWPRRTSNIRRFGRSSARSRNSGHPGPRAPTCRRPPRSCLLCPPSCGRSRRRGRRRSAPPGSAAPSSRPGTRR